MRHPQLAVCEKHPGLTEMLRELARKQKWRFRPRHQPASCLSLLRDGNPTVLVVRVGACLIDKCLERELRLLERVSWLFPDTRTVAVMETENTALTGLAWDLGAAYVLSTPRAREQLLDIITGLMEAATRCSLPAHPGK